MARKRSNANKGLPVYVYAEQKKELGTYYSYIRPDTNEKRSLKTKDKAEAIRLGTELNKVFGVTGYTISPMVARHNLIAYIRANNDISIEVKAFLRDVFPAGLHIDGVKCNLRKLKTRYAAGEYNPAARTMTLQLDRIDPSDPPAWIRKLYSLARGNSLRRKIAWDLPEKDLIALLRRCNGYCEISGIQLKLDKEAKLGLKRPWAPSLDRMNSFAGYNLANCRIVCVAANYAMNSWGEDVLIELAMGIMKVQMANEHLTGT